MTAREILVVNEFYVNIHDIFTVYEWLNDEKQCILCKPIYTDTYLRLVNTFSLKIEVY